MLEENNSQEKIPDETAGTPEEQEFSLDNLSLEEIEESSEADFDENDDFNEIDISDNSSINESENIKKTEADAEKNSEKEAGEKKGQNQKLRFCGNKENFKQNCQSTLN